jgi:hypothetical protein
MNHHFAKLASVVLVGATALPLAGCGAKALKATKVDVGAATISNRKCSGDFTAAIPLTVTREAPPAPPRKSYPSRAEGTGTTGTFVNVTGVRDATYGSQADATVTFAGNLTDTCQPGTFQVTFAATQGAAPKPSPATVTVPALGYVVPGGIPTSNGNPTAFRSTFNVKNCAGAANAFTVTATAAENVVSDPAIAQPMPVNIGPGATQQITVSGAKKKAGESGAYVIRISAPGAVECADRGLVE